MSTSRAATLQKAEANPAEIQVLYVEWQKLTKQYLHNEKEWKARKLSHIDFEALVDPIISQRDAVEKAIFGQACKGVKDLRVLTVIAAYFSWLIPDFNDAIGREATLLASSIQVNAALPNSQELYGKTSHDMTTVEGRMAWFTERYNVPVAVLSYDPVEGELVMLQALGDWCLEHGVSVDWLFVGGVVALVTHFRNLHLKVRT